MARVVRRGRGNVLYVRFTPRPQEDEERELQERRSTVMGIAAALALVMIGLALVLYLVLAPAPSPHDRVGGMQESPQVQKTQHGASGAATGASGARR